MIAIITFVNGETKAYQEGTFYLAKQHNMSYGEYKAIAESGKLIINVDHIQCIKYQKSEE